MEKRVDKHEGGDARVSGDPSFDVRQYWNVVKKRRWIILGTLTLVVAASIVLTLRKQPIYQATATVVVNPQAPKVMGSNSDQVVELGSGSAWISTDYYNTQQRVIQSRGLAEQLVSTYDKLPHDLRLVKSAPQGASEEDLAHKAVSAIYGSISAKLVKESRVFAISVQNPDPHLAAELANDAAQVYIDQNIGYKKDLTSKANLWVAKQLDAARASLRTSEEGLISYKEDNDMLSVSLEDRQNQISRDLEKFSNAESDASKQGIELQAKRRALAKLLQEDPMMFAGGQSQQGEGLDGAYSSLGKFRETYVNERLRLRGLAEKYGDKWPEVVAQKSTVDAAFADYVQAGQALIRTLDSRIEETKDTQSQHGARVAQLKAEAFELNKRAQEFHRRFRDTEMAEANYKALAQRLAESAMQESDAANNIEWLDKALVPTAPISPNVRRDIALGMALGLILALGLAFAIEMLDRSVKGQEDVEGRLGLPFLGMVPSIMEGVTDSKQPELYIARNPNSTIAECCRVVRTNIMFSSPDKPMRSFLVSSSNQSEGKTTTVINLGITMAQNGHRTLLVDTDMRRPRLHKGLRISNENGVSRFILGETELDDAIKSTDVPNLFLMPCGPHPPNPAELLQTERFAKLVELLGQKFDRVIFDSPPVLAVTDAVVLSRMVDGAILVVRAGKTSHDAAGRAKRILAVAKAKIVGVVLNDVNLQNPAYSSYYNYYNYRYAEAPQPATEGDRA